MSSILLLYDLPSLLIFSIHDSQYSPELASICFNLSIFVSSILLLYALPFLLILSIHDSLHSPELASVCFNLSIFISSILRLMALLGLSYPHFITVNTLTVILYYTRLFQSFSLHLFHSASYGSPWSLISSIHYCQYSYCYLILHASVSVLQFSSLPFCFLWLSFLSYILHFITLTVRPVFTHLSKLTSSVMLGSRALLSPSYHLVFLSYVHTCLPTFLTFLANHRIFLPSTYTLTYLPTYLPFSFHVNLPSFLPVSSNYQPSTLLFY